MAVRPEQRAEVAREILRKHLRPGQTTMRGKVILERLEKDRRIGSVIEARLYLKALKDLGEIDCTWVDRLGPVGLVTLNLRAPAQSPLETAWRLEAQAFVAGRPDARPGDEATLGDLWPKLGDWPIPLAADLFAELYGLRARFEAGELAGFTCYRASASGRLGSSKLLSLLPRAVLQAFGIDIGQFASSPPYVIVAGPPEPDAVVLVENPEAFEAAVESTMDLPVAWVSVYGFGISNIDGQGARLADMVTSTGRAITLVRSGSPPPLDALLGHQRLLHWGDFDRAGLLIFRAMQIARPNLRLSALYQPMAAFLRSGGGHPYVECTGKPRQDLWVAEDVWLSNLLELCESHAVDQEFTSCELIREFCLFSIDDVI